MKKYNNFTFTTADGVLLNEIKAFKAWIADSLKEGTEIITYVGIRYDRGAVGYKPTNPLLKAKFPFIDDL